MKPIQNFPTKINYGQSKAAFEKPAAIPPEAL